MTLLCRRHCSTFNMLIVHIQKVAQETEAFPVSLPRAAMHCDAATAAADPPEEPPGTLSMSHGLHVTYNRLTMCQQHVA